jgi:hypothetical protein
MNEPTGQLDSDQIVNRHMARLLSELEEAGCPVIFREAVKSKLAWLRSDLKAANEGTSDEAQRHQEAYSRRPTR